MSRGSVLWRFIAIGFFWGSGFVWSDIALDSMSWQFAAWSRGLVGVATLALIVLITRPKDASGRVLPREWKTWWHFGVVGVLLAAVPNALWTVGQLQVSASVASIYNATIPIATALVATLIFRIERPSGRAWLGILVGLAGVVLVIAPWNASASSAALPYQLACFGAVISVAFAFVYQRHFLAETDIHPTTAALLITVGGAAISVVMTTWWFQPPAAAPAEAWLSLIVLGAFIGGFAYIWNTTVVQEWGATGASMVTYLTPLVGVSMGVVLRGDSLSWNAPLGGLVVIAGIALSQSGSNKSTPDPIGS